jgi:hypothetical protein
MSTTGFTIYYDGPALKEGQMDIKELAPALLSIGNLFEESNRVLNDDNATVAVKVKAGFEPGSFGVDLQVCQSLSSQVSMLLTSENISAAADICTLLGFIGIPPGLALLIKKLKGRSPKNIVVLDDKKKAVVEINDNEKVEVNIGVVKLFRDYNVRKQITNICRPLVKDGIDMLKAKHNDIERVIATKDEVDYFEEPELEDEKIGESIIDQVVSIQSLSFKEDNKWLLSDGTSQFWAKITDHDFLVQIDNNTKAFSKGDRLKVKLKIIQRETSSGLKTDHEVMKVIEHNTSARQLKFPMSTEE